MQPPRVASLNTFITTLTEWLSRPVVGSSSSSSRGFASNSTPMATRLRSPPEMPPPASGEPTRESAMRVSSRRPMMSFTRALTVSSDRWRGSRMRAENNSVSRTVSVGSSWSSWYTYPIPGMPV